MQTFSSTKQNNEKDKTGIGALDGVCGEEFSLGNLREQLGFKDAIEGFINEEILRSFPLLRQCVSRGLWDHRNLLEVSIHIGNFLALSSGRHVSHMLELAPLFKERCSWKILSATAFSAPSECAAKSSSDFSDVRKSCSGTGPNHAETAGTEMKIAGKQKSPLTKI